MAKFTPSKKILTSEGGQFELILSLGTNETEAVTWDIEYYDPQDKGFGVSITNTTATTCEMRIYANRNASTVTKSHSFYVVKTSANVIKTRYLYGFTVQYDYARIIKPIWEDVECYGDGEVMEYRIIDVNTQEILYQGKAVVEPNGGRPGINVNKMCSNYLDNGLSNGIEDRLVYNDNYVKWFKIQQANNSAAGYKDIGQYRFYNSYAYGDEPATVFLNDPIKKTKNGGVTSITVDRRQYTPISVFNRTETEKNLLCRYINGGVIKEHINAVVDNTSELIKFVRDIYYDNLVSSVVFSTTDSTDGSIYVDITNTCYDYCLYYCNAYGGWDSLLIKGNVLRTDNIESHYFNKTFKNSTQEFEKKKYANVFTTTYRLHTDWFNDDEQSRLHHLLGSTEVYLHNLVTDEIEPVNITNKNIEYKTFTNNGKRKWCNTIDVEVAQTRVRK